VIDKSKIVCNLKYTFNGCFAKGIITLTKHPQDVDLVAPRTIPAGAPEIEVTPEMREVGADVLSASRDALWLPSVAEEMYIAMERARRER
jgi:hypothetical protein